MKKFSKGQNVYFIRSNIEIREAIILNYTSGFCTIRFLDSGGGIRVRESKLYATKEEAEQYVSKQAYKKRSSYKPYW